MKCRKCGAVNSPKNKFCCECGTKLMKPQPKPEQPRRSATKLVCEECNGMMTVSKDREVMSCPYCGSQKLINYSDEVKINKDNNQAELDKRQMAYDFARDLLGMNRVDTRTPEEKRKDEKTALIGLYGSFAMMIILMILLKFIL